MSNKRKHLDQDVVKAVLDVSVLKSYCEHYSDQGSVADPDYDPFLDSNNDETAATT